MGFKYGEFILAHIGSTKTVLIYLPIFNPADRWESIIHNQSNKRYLPHDFVDLDIEAMELLNFIFNGTGMLVLRKALAWALYRGLIQFSGFLRKTFDGFFDTSQVGNTSFPIKCGGKKVLFL